ncbi:uncharacterized protein ARMOST_13824 [Armillaria ostoyae]|uniref:CxC2-like cysteine cluster KDZ transposase-associated domain-containing protein n=1 Tax=Armillaria ostoyae TaxID=47428 RepID=A0A284RNW8_ARMOS|nr:uncharacterized protein ARMOST_13824 [Armillaria ostoyae]
MGDTWSPVNDTEVFLDPTDSWYEEELCAEIYESHVFKQAGVDEPPKKEKRKRTKVSKWPHMVWKDLHRQQYLDELLRREGRGEYRRDKHCPDCVMRSGTGAESLPTPEFQCRDCFLDDLCWNGEHFEASTLKDIGLHVQLNHASMQCRLPIASHQEFKVLHGNGVHHVAVDYCGCERQLPKHVQLLRRGWYPASQQVPRTAASFQLLEFLHLLSLCAKTSIYDFYRTLEKLTTNMGMAVPKSWYKALMRMLLQWQHLKMLKRGGRGHINDGVATTKDHDLVVMCLSCPWPGINLPEGWEEVPPEMQCIFICTAADEPPGSVRSEFADFMH